MIGIICEHIGFYLAELHYILLFIYLFIYFGK